LKILECDLRAFWEPVGKTIGPEAVANANPVSKMIPNVETHSWNLPSDASAASQYQNSECASQFNISRYPVKTVAGDFGFA
jgi:hypothetical protein